MFFREIKYLSKVVKYSKQTKSLEINLKCAKNLDILNFVALLSI